MTSDAVGIPKIPVRMNRILRRKNLRREYLDLSDEYLDLSDKNTSSDGDEMFCRRTGEYVINRMRDFRSSRGSRGSRNYSDSRNPYRNVSFR